MKQRHHLGLFCLCHQFMLCIISQNRAMKRHLVTELWRSSGTLKLLLCMIWTDGASTSSSSTNWYHKLHSISNLFKCIHETSSLSLLWRVSPSTNMYVMQSTLQNNKCIGIENVYDILWHMTSCNRQLCFEVFNFVMI